MTFLWSDKDLQDQHTGESALKFFKRHFEIVNDIGSCEEFLLGGNGEGETPDPIPNSAVKPLIADGSIRKSMRE